MNNYIFMWGFSLICIILVTILILKKIIKKENEYMNITGKITGIKYKPLLCNKLKTFEEADLSSALNQSAFKYKTTNGNEVAISKWVSPKRTRSFPYERVYNTLDFTGKKITIIPFVKDEGSRGDRDFLQWDTISLMSLLDVNVIVAYYTKAEKNKNYENKITSQELDVDYIKEQIEAISNYHSSALHWNMDQIKNMDKIGMKAIEEYNKISSDLSVKMHDENGILNRVNSLKKSKEKFMEESRLRAEQAQKREINVIHAGESLANDKKAALTITNYLGGNYLFTVDEAWLREDTIYLTEGKHTKGKGIPSISNIKDALLSMVLMTNLEDVKVNNKKYKSVAVIKLTSAEKFDESVLNKNQKEVWKLLKEEAKINNFEIEVE